MAPAILYIYPQYKLTPFCKNGSHCRCFNDAMTSARVYRGPLCPFKVIEAFENEGFQKYDAQYILTFLGNIVNTYMLHRVRLNNGQEGEIVYINPDKIVQTDHKDRQPICQPFQ